MGSDDVPVSSWLSFLPFTSQGPGPDTHHPEMPMGANKEDASHPKKKKKIVLSLGNLQPGHLTFYLPSSFTSARFRDLVFLTLQYLSSLDPETLEVSKLY